ncbi:hypothetical protein [Kitasatospora sp. NPDC057223]|uniref:hypothetical protein n=1 Tax=Kitasatospora sp. NPDC057223 TaxID=3346055 RepID=UPI00363A2792
MLRNVIAPERDFTQIANAQVWDDNLSDAAFRLLVRAVALAPGRLRTTTVTELAAGLAGGRITMDRARRQLAGAGLLHSTRWRDATGQVRTESLVSNVPIGQAEADELFAVRFAEDGPDGGPDDRSGDYPDGGPGAGERGAGRAALRSSGTALPTGGTLGQGEISPLPSPRLPSPRPPAPRRRRRPEPDGPPLREAPLTEEPVHADGDLAEAERVLMSLRRSDQRLVLGAAEVARLAPLAAEWLARGVSSAGLLHALTAGLPVQVKCPSALMRCRLRDKMPSALRAVPLVACTACERVFRPVGEDRRCAGCRQANASAPARPDEGGAATAGIGWRERIGMVTPA